MGRKDHILYLKILRISTLKDAQTSPVLREIYIKTLRYHFTPNRMAIVKKTRQ